jgi:citrate synthase
MGKIRSDIAWSTADRIVIRGKNFTDEILGKMNLGDFAWLQLTGKVPTPQQSNVFNAIIVALVEHGLTPSAIVARMTYHCAPESLQAAVAAGLCGLGSNVVGSMEGAARYLSEALPADAPADADLDALARQIVTRFRQDRIPVPGLGHVIHKPIDPRTPRLFAIAEENGYAGRYVRLLQLVQAEAQRASGKNMPINATGAIGAISCELGFAWKITRGFGVMARAIGLVGHILEETENPISREVWARTEEEATSHVRPGAIKP